MFMTIELSKGQELKVILELNLF